MTNNNMLLLLFTIGITAKLFIPIPEDQINGAQGQSSALISSKPQAEIEEGVDPFLVDSHESTEAPKEDNKSDNSGSKIAEPESPAATVSAATEESAQKPDNSSSASSLNGKEDKSDLDKLLEANILEEEKNKEPSKLSKAVSHDKESKPGDAFWTEVNVNGENRSVLVKIKQVTIVEKMGEKAYVSSIGSMINSAVSTVKSKGIEESVSSKASTGPFPFLKIQLPALSKIFRNSSITSAAANITLSSEKPNILSSLLRHESATPAASSKTTATSTVKSVSSVLPVSSKTQTPATTGPNVAASNDVSVSIKGKEVVASTKSKEEATHTHTTSSHPVEAVFSASSKRKENENTSKSTSVNEKILTRIITAMSSSGSAITSSKVEKAKEQTKTESVKTKEQAKTESEKYKSVSSAVSVPATVKAKVEHASSSSVHSSSAVHSAASASQSVSSGKSEPGSLGDVFDILKNMPGASKHSTNSTFIQGQFSFPKDPKLDKKVFKLSGYISG